MIQSTYTSLLPVLIVLSACASDASSVPSVPPQELVDIVFLLDSTAPMDEELVSMLNTMQSQAWRDVSEVIDYQIAITSTSAVVATGATSGADAGEAGLLYGPVIVEGPNAGSEFQQRLVCEAASWRTAGPDPAFVCPEDASSLIIDSTTSLSTQFLDCLCGGRSWRHTRASGKMGLEAAFLSMCRAVEDPPEACIEYPPDAPEGFSLAERGTNAGMLREGAETVMVVLSKSGDESPRLQGVGDTSVSPYIELFSELSPSVRVAVLGPAWNNSDDRCIEDAVPWKLERYQNAARETSGAYIDLTYLNAACDPRPFMTDLLSMLSDVP